MTNYSILRFINPASTDIPTYSQPGFFFNDWEHLRQQHTGAIRLFTALNHETQLIDARCAFFEQQYRGISPWAAPFGSIEFSEHLPDAVLSLFIDSLTSESQPDTGASLRLTNYPNCYAPAQANRLTERLLTNGYQVTNVDQNFHLPVSSQPFETTLHASERRRLTKCHRAGFTFVSGPALSASQVVDFLVSSRQKQGYTLTIPPEKLGHLLTRFPDRFRVFTVMANADIAALTVAVQVRHDILYNFLPADNVAYRSFSPAVMLTAGLYDWCQLHAIRILDLGVALDANRQPKPGLMQFKRHLGALESSKLTFEKHW